jgi:hypothetical protein
MVTLHGNFFEGTVEALDLPIGPGMGGLSEPVIDAVFVMYMAENMPSGIDLIGHIDKSFLIADQ